MSNSIFNTSILDQARSDLRNGLNISSAAVDIGGYHFETGSRDFSIWSSALMREINTAFGPRSRIAVGLSCDLPNIFYKMRDRAFELRIRMPKSMIDNHQVLKTTMDDFMAIPKPMPQSLSEEPERSGTDVPTAEKEQVKTRLRQNSQASPLDVLLSELRSHVGLESVKKEVEILINKIQFNERRGAQGYKKADQSLHMLFLGNPGTGKTTIARLIAEIYKELGILTKGHLVCTDRAGLVAGYIGQTAGKVEAVVQEALGGILFIDEAYSLAPRDSGSDFGQEAIQQLLLMMENHRKDLVVIAAGYPDEMERFLGANPGLSSRFARKLKFEDYSPDQLMQIYEGICLDNDYRLNERSRAKLRKEIQKAYNNRDKSFGNARFVRNLFEESTSNLAHRSMSAGLKDSSSLTIIDEEDIPEVQVSLKSSQNTRNLPDLGKYFATKGMAQKTMLIYDAWEIDEVSVVRRGKYCTTRIQPFEDNLYCATFDFDNRILDEILLRAPKATREFVRRSLSQDPDAIRRIPLLDPVRLGVQAKLGDLQQGMNELFIPLIIMSVFGSDPIAVLEEVGDFESAEYLRTDNRSRTRVN